MNPDDVKAVTEANEEFYAAFEALDMDRMEACWLHDEEVRCIHPGWDVMTGWPQVGRSWVAIFANSAYIQFFLTDVRVHVRLDQGRQQVVRGVDVVVDGVALVGRALHGVVTRA